MCKGKIRHIILSTLALLFQFSVLAQSMTDARLTDSLLWEIKNSKNQLHISNNEQNTTIFKNIGANYQRLNKFDSAACYYALGADNALKMEQNELYSSIVYNLSLVYFSQGQYQKALNYALIALKNDELQNKPNNIAASLNSIALIYQEWGIYDKALDYRLQAIKLAQDNKLDIEIANGNYNLGSLYLKLGKTQQALSYFTLAQKNYTQLISKHPINLNIKQGLSESIYSIGGINIHERKYSEAQALFNQALKLKSALADKIGMGNCYYQIGLTYYLQNNFEAARQNLFLSLQYKSMINDKKGMALVYFRLSDMYFKQNKITESESFIKKSLATATEINDHEILKENYKILYEIYHNKGEFKNALQYHELYKSYTDSILNENTTKIVEELSVRFETDKKEKENVILLHENQIKSLTIQKQKWLGVFMSGVIILVLLIVGILYKLYQSKRKTNKIISHKNSLLGLQNTQIAQQNVLIEKRNRDVTDSIRYAKQIQDSMLSDMQNINSELDDAFILFKPKDIVSGDFYWFGKKNNKFIVAAIDCTGHGVPGAFMSMLGNSFMNQIVHNMGITSPQKILNELSTEVQNALKQSETNNKDGMDMALCTIDLETKEVEFAGAKNPLIHIKNGEAQRIKGDKMPIGINHYKDAPFTNHNIDSSETDCFYLFSDGYPDQFGGEKGKKFMIKRFQQLLVEIHSKPMNEQKNILDKTITEWMGSNKQIDDILVIGFRINQ